VAPVSEPDFDGFDANIAEAERARLKECIADDKARVAAINGALHVRSLSHESLLTDESL